MCVTNVYEYAVGYLKAYVSHTSVWGKQLTENRDEHLSLTGPRGGKGAAIMARP